MILDFQIFRTSRQNTGEQWSARIPTSVRFLYNHFLQHLGGRRICVIRAKVPSDPKHYPQRRQRGMRKCGNNCTACPFIREVKSLNINRSEWKINQSLDCNISYCVYLIECKKDKWNMKYVGETKRILKFRLADHRGYVNNLDETQATGKHFNHQVTVFRIFQL